MGAKAYEDTMRRIEDPKLSEARVFSAVTNGLERHASEGRTSENLKDYLAKNQRLWVNLRNAAAASDNQLPMDLRGRLVSLALWVDRYTSDILKGTGDVQDIISVNRSIMAGLTGATGVSDGAQATA